MTRQKYDFDSYNKQTNSSLSSASNLTASSRPHSDEMENIREGLDNDEIENIRELLDKLEEFEEISEIVEKVEEFEELGEQPCLHDLLEEQRPPWKRGEPHQLSCPCPKCTPRF